MKRPFYSEQDRLDVRMKTYRGACIELDIAYMQFIKSIRKDYGCVIAYFVDIKLKKTRINN